MRILRLFFRPAGLDFADMGAGVFSGIANQYAAHTLPQYRTQVGGYGLTADAMWAQAMAAIQSATDRNTGMVDPVILDSYSKMLGIDLTGILQAGQAAGDQYGSLAGTAGNFGGAAAGAGFGALDRGASIWQTAQDPNQELHNYLRTQTIDTSRAADSARGLAMSPYSTGNESDAVRKFEMDWQNQMLGRQIAGGGAANAADQAGMADFGASLGYYGMQPGFTMSAEMTPVSAQQYVYGAPMDYATQFTGAQQANVIGPQMGLQGQANPYLGLAQGSIDRQSQYDMNRAMVKAGLTDKAIGQFNTGYRGESGAGNPMNWFGMGG